MEKLTKLDKILTEHEKRLKKTTQNVLLARMNIYKHLFNRAMLKIFFAQKDFEEKKHIDDEALKKGNEKESYKATMELCEAVNRVKRLDNLWSETRNHIFKNASHLQGLSDAEPLNEIEKQIIKEEPKMIEDAIRLYEGVLKQTRDFFTGRFELIINAGKGDAKAQEQILKELEQLRKNMKWKYKNVGSKSGIHVEGKSKLKKRYYQFTHEGLDDADIYFIMMEAIKDWRKNKYFSQFEWIRGYIKRQLKGVLKSDYRQKKIWKSIDPGMGDELGWGDEEIQEFVKEDEKGDVKEDLLWIEEVAEIIGVETETLRNWDKKEIFKAEKIEKLTEEGLREYRGYRRSDIPLLWKIAKEQLNKRKHAVEDHCLLTDLSKIVGKSTRTILRMEEAGKLPKAKRDEKGYRIYSLADVEKIKKILNK